MGWLFICVFRAVGLARVASLPRLPKMARGRTGVDIDTVKALFTHRMHVLRDYRRRVIRPVFRQLSKEESTPPLSLSDSRLLIRHPSLLDAQGGRKLSQLLRRHDVLRTVVEFRDRLQRIWDEMSVNDAPALEQLRILCTDAARSHVPALRRFALRLPTYSLANRTPCRLH
jgi:stearoyl-CoA desaturase (delta-9 desaturase)